jgi:hypothetical protein
MVEVSTRSSSINYGFARNTRFRTGFSLYPLSVFTRRCVLIFEFFVFDAELNSLSNGVSFEQGDHKKIMAFAQKTGSLAVC